MKDSNTPPPLPSTANGFIRQLPALLPLRASYGQFSDQQSNRSMSRERILNYLEEALRILDEDEDELFEEECMGNPQDPPPSSGPSNQER
jgi:hypothetical protein